MRINKQQQRGAVLVWGVVILLTLTIIGIAATRMATVDSRIAGNQMTTMLTFQGADSALRESINLYQVVKTTQEGVKPTDEYTKFNTRVFSLPSKEYGGVDVKPIMKMSEEDGCPPLNGIAMSAEMTPDAGGIACRIFTADADASLPGTGAKSRHSEGALKPVPKFN